MDIKKISFCVEGQDCSGKTTIIKEIQSRLPHLKYHHFEFPLGDNNDEKYGYQHGQFDLMFKMLDLCQDSTQFIFDRAHIGEYIWSPIYRDKHPGYLLDLEKRYKDLPIVLICVTCEPDVVLKRFIKRGEQIPSNIEELGESFVKHCKESSLTTVYVNTTHSKDPLILVDNMIQLIELV